MRLYGIALLLIMLILAACQADNDRSSAIEKGNQPDRVKPRVLDNNITLGDPDAVENLNPKKPGDRTPIRVTSVRMDDTPNPAMVGNGLENYNGMCKSCHSSSGSNQAASLKNILKRRDPAWVMNFLYFPGFEVNAAAEGRCWVRQPGHILNVIQARDLVEYLRTI